MTVFSQLQSGLDAWVRRVFAEFVPSHLWSILFVAFVALLVAGGFGGALGLDNLFYDSAYLVDLSEEKGWRVFLNSPTLLTSFFLLYLSFIVVFFNQHTRRSILRSRTSAFSLSLGNFVAVFKPTLLLYAALLAVWLIVGRGPTYRGEELRVALGGIAGILVCALAFALTVFNVALFQRVLVGMRWALIRLAHLLHGLRAQATAGPPSLRNRALELSQRPLLFIAAQARTQYRDILARREYYEYFLFVLPTLIVLVVIFLWHKLIPVVGLFLLLSFAFVFLRALFDLPIVVRYAAAGLLVLAVLFPPVERFRLQFDGIVAGDGGSHYGAPLDLDRLRFTRSDAAQAEQSSTVIPTSCAGGASLFEPVSAVDALDAWLARQSASGGAAKPKLLMVATSGGAYRAAYWTAMVLDRLAAESAPGGALPGMAQAVRLITGASGGMVGAAYFAAMAGPAWPAAAPPSIEQAIDRDILESQGPGNSYGTLYPIRSDSLAPVAQHLIQTDIPSLLWPLGLEVDRGKVLERQWKTLALSFAELRAGQAEGWRPSLILSPMIVETGQPLLISNLDLGFLQWAKNDEAAVFFGYFPCAHASFRLATAVRMNASFPFISPAVSLPTVPERRVVDAGYYDNYGVSLAAAYLNDRDIRTWLEAHSSGVILLQIRAFPLQTGKETYCVEPEPEQDPSWFESFEWLTSPVEAAIRARGTSMAFRNEQELRAARRLYPAGFIETVTFVNSAEVSMNWDLPKDEKQAMRDCFERQWAHNLPTLRRLWRRAPGAG